MAGALVASELLAQHNAPPQVLDAWHGIRLTTPSDNLALVALREEVELSSLDAFAEALQRRPALRRLIDGAFQLYESTLESFEAGRISAEEVSQAITLADFTIHLTLWSVLSQNAINFASFLAALDLFPVGPTSGAVSQALRRSLDDHHRFYDALCSGDHAAAAAALRDHYARAREHLKRSPAAQGRTARDSKDPDRISEGTDRAQKRSERAPDEMVISHGEPMPREHLEIWAQLKPGSHWSLALELAQKYFPDGEAVREPDRRGE